MPLKSLPSHGRGVGRRHPLLSHIPNLKSTGRHDKWWKDTPSTSCPTTTHSCSLSLGRRCYKNTPKSWLSLLPGDDIMFVASNPLNTAMELAVVTSGKFQLGKISPRKSSTRKQRMRPNEFNNRKALESLVNPGLGPGV